MRCIFSDVLGCLGISEDPSRSPIRHLHTTGNFLSRVVGLTLLTEKAENRTKITTAPSQL